jgi:PAS domain-containing protein
LDVEARWHTIGGSQRWIASRARLIRGDDGRPVRMIGANSDVTERKLLEVELAEPLLA